MSKKDFEKTFCASKERARILVVDDDEAGRRALAEVLRVNGYVTTEAATGKEAIEKIRKDRLNVALLDIKLPDMEGTQVLSIIRNISPRTIVIMITGFPTVENASTALNIGADSYFVKPFAIEDILNTIKRKLHEREETRQRHVVEFAKLRLSQSQLGEYGEFSEKIANKLVPFGINKTQAKVYLAASVLGSALASEISELSGIRREEVYRTLNALKYKGLVTSNYNVHNRFSATNPSLALTSLAKSRIRELKKQAKELLETRKEVLSNLDKTFFEFASEPTIEPVYQIDYMKEKLVRAVKQTRESILIAMSTEEFGLDILRLISKQIKSIHNSVRVKIMLNKTEMSEATRLKTQNWIDSFKTGTTNNMIELRQANFLPFKMVIIDDSKAMWGEFLPDDSSKVFWTNDPMQLYILEVAFDRLWWQSQVFLTAKNVSV
jgi:CheY-like chemotaxis protein/sugar-specific transcriptional regulator TrmB